MLSLPATLLFDYPSIATLSAYIATDIKHISNNSYQMCQWKHRWGKLPAQVAKPEAESAASGNQIRARQPNAQESAAVATDPKIAIVGMSDQFGAATDLDAFWAMLENSRPLW